MEKIQILMFCFLSIIGQCQIIEYFTDNDLQTGTVWEGDLALFTVNTLGQLQLNDDKTNVATLYTRQEIPDSFIFQIAFEMDFAPSGSNFTEIYLNYDNEDFKGGNGLIIKLGTNGSDDAVELWSEIDGQGSLLYSGSAGGIANQPSSGKITCVQKSNSIAEIKINYPNGSIDIGNTVLPEEGINGSYFGIRCNYTSSRAKLFYFDDIILKEFEPDTEPPKLQSVEVLDDKTISCTWNESVDTTKISKEQICINGNPVSSIEIKGPSKIEAKLDNNLDGLTPYILTCKEISDLEGNIMVFDMLDFTYTPYAKDQILLSEILFNPQGNGSDYVEIYNISNQPLKLGALKIVNKSNGQEQRIPEVIIEAGGYLAFSENIEETKTTFQTPQIANIIEMDLPSFNNDKGNVSIVDQDGKELDSYDYDEDQHSPFLDDVDGVSLERKSFEINANDVNNWSSASTSVQYGTPGYPNSNGISAIDNNLFKLQQLRFSPNNDGQEDECIITYNLGATGYIINADIYSSDGYHVGKAADNAIAGVKGIITWDGSTKDGQRAKIGTYLIALEAFNENGDVVREQFAVNLVDFIGR